MRREGERIRKRVGREKRKKEEMYMGHTVENTLDCSEYVNKKN